MFDSPKKQPIKNSNKKEEKESLHRRKKNILSTDQPLSIITVHSKKFQVQLRNEKYLVKVYDYGKTKNY